MIDNDISHIVHPWSATLSNICFHPLPRTTISSGWQSLTLCYMSHNLCQFWRTNKIATLLSLIDEPVRLFKRRPILHTGSFVVYRFVYWKKYQSRPQQAEFGVFWAIIVAHSSVKVNTNSLLECGPRIIYMYTNTWIIQNAQNTMMSNFISDTLIYQDLFSKRCFCEQVLLTKIDDFSNRCFYSERFSIRDKRVKRVIDMIALQPLQCGDRL